MNQGILIIFLRKGEMTRDKGIVIRTGCGDKKLEEILKKEMQSAVVSLNLLVFISSSIGKALLVVLMLNLLRIFNPTKSLRVHESLFCGNHIPTRNCRGKPW